MKATHILAMLMLCIAASAQTTSIPYQAVARDTFNTPLPDRTISLRFSIREGSSGGTVLYKETDSVTTNKLGLFTTYIGEGTPVTGTFAAINWGSGAKFLQVEADAAGGTSYTSLGSNELKSVPFSLRAASADNIASVPNKRVPYATSSGLTSDANFTRDSAGGNTRIKTIKGSNYYALEVGDSVMIDNGGSPINIPSACLKYGDTTNSFAMTIGVGNNPTYGINKMGFLNLNNAAGSTASLVFMENSGNPEIQAAASRVAPHYNVGSTLQLKTSRAEILWRNNTSNKHGIVADSLTLKLYSSLGADNAWTWPNTEGPAGSVLTTNGYGNLSFAPLPGNTTAMGIISMDYANGLSTDTIAISNSQNNIYNASYGVTNLLVQLPASPANGDVFILTFQNPVTTITYTGGTVSSGALTTATSSSQKIYTYHAATNKWY